MTSRMRAIVLVAGAGLALLLGGCAWSGSGYGALERDREASDELPKDVMDGSSDIDADSARFVGAHDGVEFWLARMDQPESVCLVVYPNDADWVIGCGGFGSPLGVGGPSGDYVLVPDGAPAPEHTTKLTDNVYVAGD